MAKRQKRGNRDIRKLEQEKPISKSADPFANPTGLAASTGTKRVKIQMRWS